MKRTAVLLITALSLSYGGLSFQKVDTLFEYPAGAKCSPGIADWNSDGLPDILLGDGYGNVWFYKNCGTAAEPLFNNQNRTKLHADGAVIAVGGST